MVRLVSVEVQGVGPSQPPGPLAIVQQSLGGHATYGRSAYSFSGFLPPPMGS